jgi:Predicted membrane protein
MFYVLLVVTAAASYLIGGINPAIILSKAIYHKDIREYGSRNPGFTNFRRVFGDRYAWYVMLLDLSKAAIPILVFSLLFKKFYNMRQFGAAYAGLCVMLGHAYPIWYRFKGGKSFLTGAATIWFVDWRAGLVALVVMMILLFTVKYMSLSVICAALTCPVTLGILGTSSSTVEVISILCVLLMIYRHKENMKRLLAGTESKFTLARRG